LLQRVLDVSKRREPIVSQFHCGGNLGGEDHGPCVGPAPARPGGPRQT
jgi:hypothetical protein